MHNAPSSHATRPVLVVWIVLAGQLACTSQPSAALGTPEQRAALFDYLIERTAEREAFSPVKNEAMSFDPMTAMRVLRDDVIDATSESELFYALSRLSNARRDRHLSLALVPGGLQVPDTAGLEVAGREPVVLPRHAPVKLQTDYGNGDGYTLFVSDVAVGVETGAAVGDRVTAINGHPVEEYLRQVEPYIRYSSVPNLWWTFADLVPARTAVLPPHFYRDDALTLELNDDAGDTFAVSLPYVPWDSLRWTDVGEPRYDGFSLAWAGQTFDLFTSDDDLPALVLRWHGFREHLVRDIDALMDSAGTRGWLDHALIVDATRSRGGSKGAYAVQRMTSQPFKTTFGNLKISDVIPPFIAAKQRDFELGGVEDGDVPETLDDGTWLLEWLETDVEDAIRAGAPYSNDVPFKLAHAPRQSDGVLPPAPVHFRGPLVVFSGPRRGSHLDQFVAIVVDNDLGHVIGMPAGGYSNTWEWEETLVYPGTDQPVVQFMWNIGHTIRPNGDILEGRAAPVHEFIPVTRENFLAYYDHLMERALATVGIAR